MRCDKSEPLLSNPSLHSPTNPSRALSHLRVVHGAVADGRAQLTVAEAVTYKWKKEWGGEEVFVVGNDTNWTELAARGPVQVQVPRGRGVEVLPGRAHPGSNPPRGVFETRLLNAVNRAEGERRRSPEEPTKVQNPTAQRGINWKIVSTYEPKITRAKLGNRVDVKGNRVDVKGNRVDVKGLTGGFRPFFSAAQRAEPAEQLRDGGGGRLGDALLQDGLGQAPPHPQKRPGHETKRGGGGGGGGPHPPPGGALRANPVQRLDAGKLKKVSRTFSRRTRSERFESMHGYMMQKVGCEARSRVKSFKKSKPSLKKANAKRKV
eukprot:1179039-Prorocentrum_minimum.AAC.2